MPPAVLRALTGSLVVACAVGSRDALADGSEPRPPDAHFVVDPVTDGVLIATGIGFSTLLGTILGTGEIRPTVSTADPNVLLPLDRAAVTQSLDRSASTYSDLGLYTATAFAVIDPLLSWWRYGWNAFLVDAVLYGESTSLTSALTSVLKIAIRRPRPVDYAARSTTDTNMVLSFPSGHASGVASVGATATYLAFVRAPGSPRPWITLAAFALLAGFVDYERVRAGAHFPTDVAAGTLLGITTGVLVPHFHRRADEPSVVLGVAPAPDGTGAALTLRGRL
jgi:undecaprenyl-diphosphatase